MALRNLSCPSKLTKIMLFNCRIQYKFYKGLSSMPKDIESHTGQIFDEKDYRLARFIDKSKHVNPNWAIKLIAEVPPTKVNSRVVWCDGGSGPTGHPKVYINLDKPGIHSCNYCGLRFEKLEEHH